jgi:hypothetical protein
MENVIDYNGCFFKGSCPVFIASDKENYELAKYFIEHVDMEKNLALKAMYIRKDQKMIDYLVANGASYMSR